MSDNSSACPYSPKPKAITSSFIPCSIARDYWLHCLTTICKQTIGAGKRNETCTYIALMREEPGQVWVRLAERAGAAVHVKEALWCATVAWTEDVENPLRMYIQQSVPLSLHLGVWSVSADRVDC